MLGLSVQLIWCRMERIDPPLAADRYESDAQPISAPTSPDRNPPVSAEDGEWRATTTELARVTSVAYAGRARQVLICVSLAGSVLVGLGLVASTRMDRSSPARLVAVASVGLALVAVVVGLGSLLLQRTPAPPAATAPAWYRRTPPRGWAPTAAGLSLLLAIVAAGAATVLVLVDTPEQQPTVSAQMIGIGAGARLTVRVEFTGVTAGQILHTEVAGVDATDSRTVLARAVANAGSNGKVSATVEVTGLGEYRTVEVNAELAAQRCTATLVPGWNATPATLMCTGQQRP
jgi:hypothetical protein